MKFKLGDLVIVKPRSNPEGLLGYITRINISSKKSSPFNYVEVTYYSGVDNFGRSSVHCELDGSSLQLIPKAGDIILHDGDYYQVTTEKMHGWLCRRLTKDDGQTFFMDWYDMKHGAQRLAPDDPVIKTLKVLYGN